MTDDDEAPMRPNAAPFRVEPGPAATNSDTPTRYWERHGVSITKAVNYAAWTNRRFDDPHSNEPDPKAAIAQTRPHAGDRPMTAADLKVPRTVWSDPDPVSGERHTWEEPLPWRPTDPTMQQAEVNLDAMNMALGYKGPNNGWGSQTATASSEPRESGYTGDGQQRCSSTMPGAPGSTAPISLQQALLSKLDEWIRFLTTQQRELYRQEQHAKKARNELLLAMQGEIIG